MNANISLQL